MTIRVVCNARLDMTNYEYSQYQKICQSYDDHNFKGSDLFYDLFESDENGIITALKPPSKRATSLEVFLFLVVLQQQQHIRLMFAQVDDLADQVKIKLKEYDDRISKLEEKKKK